MIYVFRKKKKYGAVLHFVSENVNILLFSAEKSQYVVQAYKCNLHCFLTIIKVPPNDIQRLVEIHYERRPFSQAKTDIYR